MRESGITVGTNKQRASGTVEMQESGITVGPGNEQRASGRAEMREPGITVGPGNEQRASGTAEMQEPGITVRPGTSEQSNNRKLPMRNIEKARLNIFESDSKERKDREKAATASVLDRLNED